VNGFQFILMDTASQVQNLILNYITMIEKGGAAGISVVQLFQFIFSLSLTEPRTVSSK
jgi:hypothetical protein